jgi:hypothetical protein
VKTWHAVSARSTNCVEREGEEALNKTRSATPQEAGACDLEELDVGQEALAQTGVDTVVVKAEDLLHGGGLSNTLLE